MTNAPRVIMEWASNIPVRDGTKLSVTLYRPEEQSAPAPCVLTMSPYVGDLYHARGMYFAAEGFVFAVVDVRGRGNSEGEFRPFLQEAQDGYDVVEWLAAQPWCDGRVMMRGGSYCGHAQWATAGEAPPHLAAIAPAAAPVIGLDFPRRNGIYLPYALQWLTLTGGRAAQPRIFADEHFWASFYRRWHESGRAFRELDVMLEHPSPLFQAWLDHPDDGAYWDAHNPSAEQYGRMELPVLSITGIYDDDQPGAIEHYRRHLRHAAPGVSAKHHLVIGPWDHAGTASPNRTVGGVTFGPDSQVDLLALHRDWFRWILGEGERPSLLSKPVAYYVTGAERWQHADSLEAVTRGYRLLYLDSSGQANDVFASGWLSETKANGAPDSYRFDPARTDGPEIAVEADSRGGDLTDQRLLHALGGRLLVYHSAPFAEDTEVSGFFELDAWLSIDTPDTDIYISIYEIALDGTSIRLSTDAMRARYRRGLSSSEQVNTAEPLRYDFASFTFVSRLIRRGHRLRLVAAPMGRLLETTFAQKNYGAGGTVADETIADARTVTVRLFHDAEHPSVLRVPLGRSSPSRSQR